MLALIDNKDGGGRVSRRAFLEVGALGAIGFGLPEYLAVRDSAGPAADAATACILIFNVGGPSHVDTFDMKPEAPPEIRGPFQPIPTRSPEMSICELFPHHARVADKFSLVRSCHHRGPAVHDAGWQMMQTGRLFTGGVQTPHAGAAAAYLRPAPSSLPSHVVLPDTMGRGGGNLPHGQAGGFLGAAFDPFVPARESAESGEAGAGIRAAELGAATVGGAERLRDAVGDSLRRLESSAAVRSGDVHTAAAYGLLANASTGDAFDLSREPRSARERYGRSRFGRCCLLARRLVERGVPFVTINTFLTVFDQVSWDTHGCRPFTTLAGLRDAVAPMYDRAYAALIEDLDQRGLLPTTLVCNLCEFGRTPRINAAGGRDHWPQCYTVYFAGGGVQGGRVVGRSDSMGGSPEERPVDPGAIVATIFHALGLRLSARLPGPEGTPYPLVDPGSAAIHELFV